MVEGRAVGVEVEVVVLWGSMLREKLGTGGLGLESSGAEIWIVGLSSGRLIIGIPTGRRAGSLSRARTFSGTGERARLASSTGGCQFGSKLTIGRPGFWLTAVGEGRFGLRSRKRLLVACRISSLRISMPSGSVGLFDASASLAVAESGGVGSRALPIGSVRVREKRFQGFLPLERLLRTGRGPRGCPGDRLNEGAFGVAVAVDMMGF